MPKFPKREADIEVLAMAMSYGYWSHGADFPSAHFAVLAAAYNVYNTAKKAQTEAGYIR